MSFNYTCRVCTKALRGESKILLLVSLATYIQNTIEARPDFKFRSATGGPLLPEHTPRALAQLANLEVKPTHPTITGTHSLV